MTNEMIEAIHRAFDRLPRSPAEILENIQRARASRRGNHSLAPTQPQPNRNPNPDRTASDPDEHEV